MIVRPDWTGRTVVCIASGWSLTEEDCERVKVSGLPAIVTNTTFRKCPWADALYGFDARWWLKYREEVKQSFRGLCYGGSMLCAKHGAFSTIGVPWFKQFRNSGVCAISLALSGNAAKVVLLGYDASLGPDGETHHHGNHPPELNNAESMGDWPRQFEIVAKEGRKLGVPIVNASRRTALTCFPRATLDEAL